MLRQLDAAGHRSWLVGGAVRDLLQRRGRKAAADFDIATPALPRRVMALFPRVLPTGVEHGTVTVLAGGEPIEVTTFRGEGPYLDGRRPSSVTFHSHLEADLARRDFTMNALAYDPIGRELRDPFGGRADMRRRLIRAVGDPAARFREDGLRPLRAARFAAQLGYRVEPRTRAAIRGTIEAVGRVSAERVADELSRLLAAARPAAALALLMSTGLLGVVLPALGARSRGEQAHALAVAAAVRPEPVLRFAALLHVLGPEQAAHALGALRLSSRLAGEVGALLRAGACLRAGIPRLPESDEEVRRWLSRVGAARAATVLALWEADAASLGRRGSRHRRAIRRLRSRVERILRSRPPLTTGDLALDGRAVMEILGLPPGPEVGNALQHLLDRVLGDPRLNAAGPLRAELKRWKAAHP